MHNFTKNAFVILGIACILFAGACSKTGNGKTTRTYTIQTPILKPLAEVLTGINGNAGEPISAAGKIYIKDQYVFINEVDKGIHIIDNTNPARPVQVSFLHIPGNQDIAVKDNILYADMYASLLAIDITDLHHPAITKIVPRFFVGRQFVNGYYSEDSSKVITGWIKKDTTVIEDVVVYPRNNCTNCYFLATADTKSASATGVAGSMAAMVLLNDYLYAIAEPHSIGIMDVTKSASPVNAGTMFAGFDLQTIFPFKDKLFLGSAIGMFMLDVSDPVHPVSIGQFSHGRACDPVVTDGSYAYVTLHAGTTCGGTSNELNVIDIKDVKNSSLVKSYPLTKPTGLSKDGDLLFVCDGSDGVKLYNAQVASNLKLLKQIKITDPYDVIAGGNQLIVVTKTGLYQYDYHDVNNIKQLSFFSTRQ